MISALRGMTSHVLTAAPLKLMHFSGAQHDTLRGLLRPWPDPEGQANLLPLVHPGKLAHPKASGPPSTAACPVQDLA